MLTRRDFVAGSVGGLVALATGDLEAMVAGKNIWTGTATVAMVRNDNRAEAVPRAIDLLGINPVQGKSILLKPNFNTADPFPASSHNDTLLALVVKLKQMGATAITIGERCGPPETALVIRDKGIDHLCRQQGIGLINFEELQERDWIKVRPPGSHWHDGFEVARPVLEAESVVSTCCLKTHGYGGVFTMSLKLSVGITHKRNMRELHTSLLSMRKMIAEINQAYTPDLIVMDGIEAFTDGGPSHGTLKKPGVMLAATDRVALDAVGLAILKEQGSNRKIMETQIFVQEQISRAVELGLGISSPAAIKIISDTPQGRRYANKLMEILKQEKA